MQSRKRSRRQRKKFGKRGRNRKFRNSITESEFALSGIQKEFQENERFEKQFEEYLEAQKSRNYIYLKEASARQLQQLGKKKKRSIRSWWQPAVLIPKIYAA